MRGCTGLPATGPSIAWGTGLPAAAHRGYWLGCYMPQVGLGVMTWLLQAPAWPGGTGLAATAHRGLWPGCYSPQGARAWLLQTPGWPEVLAWLLQAIGCPVGTGLAATALRIAWVYWSGCYRPQHDLWVLALLLQAQGWPVATGLAARAHRCTGLAATSPMLAWGTGLPTAAHQVLQS